MGLIGTHRRYQTAERVIVFCRDALDTVSLGLGTILLDAEWASKCFALEVKSPTTPFWGIARRNITPRLFALLHGES
jgi:hypothetical protein